MPPPKLRPGQAAARGAALHALKRALGPEIPLTKLAVTSEPAQLPASFLFRAVGRRRLCSWPAAARSCSAPKHCCGRI